MARSNSVFMRRDGACPLEHDRDALLRLEPRVDGVVFGGADSATCLLAMLSCYNTVALRLSAIFKSGRRSSCSGIVPFKALQEGKRTV